MKKQHLLIACITAVLFITSIRVFPRAWRVSQIPNGQVNSCANCHSDPGGGGPRNPFGQEVEKRVTVGGTEEFWNASLAALDSDGDGISNGRELQDPTGAWRSGQPNPGNMSLVTNPGDPNSKTGVKSEASLPSVPALLNNYPNPFNPGTTIKYLMPVETPFPGNGGTGIGSLQRVTLKVYDLLGREVAALVDEEKPPGYYTIYWNGTDKSGNKAAAGIYLYTMRTGSFTQTMKMVLLK